MNIYLLLATIDAILGIAFIKQYIITKNKLYLLLTFILYTLLIYIYTKLFENTEVSSTYTILQILQILIILIIGIIFFKESLNITKLFGIILGSLSVYLLLKN